MVSYHDKHRRSATLAFAVLFASATLTLLFGGARAEGHKLTPLAEAYDAASPAHDTAEGRAMREVTEDALARLSGQSPLHPEASVNGRSGADVARAIERGATSARKGSVVRLAQAARLFPATPQIGATLGPIWLAATAGYVGFQIGEELRRYVAIVIPGYPTFDGSPSYPAYSSELRWHYGLTQGLPWRHGGKQLCPDGCWVQYTFGPVWSFQSFPVVSPSAGIGVLDGFDSVPALPDEPSDRVHAVRRRLLDVAEVRAATSNERDSSSLPHVRVPVPTAADVREATRSGVQDAANSDATATIENTIVSGDPNVPHVDVPSPHAGESGTTYSARLHSLGLHTRRTSIAEWAADTEAPPNAVIAVRQRDETVPRGSTVDVVENPSSQPTPLPLPPVYTSSESDECDVPPGGSGTDPADELPEAYRPSPFEERIGSATDPGEATNFERVGEPSTFLLWGSTQPPAWGGWGYRHISAKHGWNEVVERQVRQTLADPAHLRIMQENGRLFYAAARERGYFVQAGGRAVFCLRVVIVEPTQIGESDGFEQPSGHLETGIWTSYGLATAAFD